MQTSFHKTNSMNAFLYAMRYGTVRDKVMTALPASMNRKNIVKVRQRGKTLTECLSSLTECSEPSIRIVLGDLDATHWGIWDRCKGTFKVNKDIATCDTKQPAYEGPPLGISEADRIRLESRISGLFEIETRTRYRNEDKEMTKAMMKKISELERQNEEISKQNQAMMMKHDETLSLLREILSGQATREKIVSHLRLVESDE
jgi:hypothetical protein